MKITNRHILTILAPLFIMACSNEETFVESQENFVTQGAEEYNIQVVENDPDFTKTTTASKDSDPIEVEAAQIRTYLAKDKNAKGRVYYELYRNVDGSNKLIARSGSFDVQK